MRSNWTRWLAAGTLALAAGTAAAGTVNYTFDGGNTNNLGTSTSFGAAPYSITVSAYYSVTGGAWQAANVSRNNDALGVNSGLGSNPGQIDSNGSNRIEGLLFDFGSLSFGQLTVTLDAYRTGGLRPDSLSVWIGNTLDLSGGAPLETTIFDNQTPANPFTIGFGTRYLFIAAAEDGLDLTNCSGDANCFRVDNITAVPEPGSLALAGLALGGLALAARRRQRG